MEMMMMTFDDSKCTRACSVCVLTTHGIGREVNKVEFSVPTLSPLSSAAWRFFHKKNFAALLQLLMRLS